MSNNPVAEALKVALADSYALYIKTQNYHWNVTGPQFNGLHLMFENQYTDLAAAIDTIAERIRALGEKAPGSFKRYTAVTNISDGDENNSSQAMLEDLYKSQQIIGKTLSAALEKAETANDQVTIDLMTQRLAVHEKNAWMLKSTIGN